jgi:hypothetical protein
MRKKRKTEKNDTSGVGVFCESDATTKSHFHFHDGDGVKSTQSTMPADLPPVYMQASSVNAAQSSAAPSDHFDDTLPYDPYDHDSIYNDFHDDLDPPEDKVKDEDPTEPFAGIVFKRAERQYEKSVNYTSLSLSYVISTYGSHVKGLLRQSIRFRRTA